MPGIWRKVQKSTGFNHCPDPELHEIRREIPEAVRKVGATGKNVEERVGVAKRYRRAPSQ